MIAPATPTPQPTAYAAYERAARRRDAAAYVVTKVPLEEVLDAHAHYQMRAREADAALAALLAARTPEVSR